MMQSVFDFLANLEKNNNKPWFDQHRKEYEAAKNVFEEFVTGLQQKMVSLDPAFGEQKAKDNIFRIFRDVRFSKDKTPYKTHFGAYFSRAGKKAPDAGYYLHIQPGGSFAGGGLWLPEGPLLKAVRQEIDYNLASFEKILSAKPYKKYFNTLEGEKLKTLPAGYTQDNPAIEYLKMKSFVTSTKLTDKEITARNSQAKIMDVFTAMKPLVDFLNSAID